MMRQVLLNITVTTFLAFMAIKVYDESQRNAGIFCQNWEFYLAVIGVIVGLVTFTLTYRYKMRIARFKRRRARRGMSEAHFCLLVNGDTTRFTGRVAMEWRKAFGLSQEEFAKGYGFDLKALRRWEGNPDAFIPHEEYYKASTR